MNHSYDVVVVGAGCAGALASSRIASNGFSVLLVDRRREAEICRPTRDIVEEAALREAGVASGIDLESRQVTSVEAISPDTATSILLKDVPLRVVDRGPICHRLLDEARDAGVQVLTECVVGAAEVDRGFATGVSTDRGSFSCRLLVEASGLERVLCRDIPKGMGIPRRLRTSDHVSAYVETRQLNEDSPGIPAAGTVRYHLGHFGGFNWTHFAQDGTIDVGTAVQDVKGAPDPRDIVLGYVRSSPPIGEKVLLRVGGRVPTRRPLSTMVANGMMLVGDAACQAAPLLLRGMGGALVGAFMLAATAVRALQAGDVSAAGLWSYNHDYMHARGADMAALDCMRLFMQKLTEKEFSWCMARKVIDESAISTMLTGKLAGRPPARIRSYIRGFGSTPLDLRYENTMRLAHKVAEHYRSYPRAPEAPEYAQWSAEAEFLFDDAWKL